MIRRLKFIQTKIWQFVVILGGQLLALFLLGRYFPDLKIDSLFSALVFLAAYLLAQVIFWWVFVEFFSRLPIIFYPLITFALNGAFVSLLSGYALDIQIERPETGIWMILTLTAANTVSGSLLSIEGDPLFDRVIIRKLARRYSVTAAEQTSGLIFLEIDGLGKTALLQALERGCLPTLERWLQNGTHRLIDWETDFSSQTASMQAGILLGNNENIPAYRWWDRKRSKIIVSGNPFDAKEIEARQSNGGSLLKGGGTSRGNMFSGGAAESLFTISTLVERQQSAPGFYLFLFNPIILARILTRFLIEIIEELWDAVRQKLSRVKYALPWRYFYFALFRGFMGAVVQELATYTVIGDLLRGTSCVYVAYPAYDDLAHYAGLHSPEALRMLRKIDRHIARIARAAAQAPRSYHLVILSDHGMSEGRTFETAYQISLPDLVKKLAHSDEKICAMLETEETWHKINAALSDTIQFESRTAGVLKTMLTKNIQDGLVTVGPKRKISQEREINQARHAGVIVLASGCMGLIYIRAAQQRLTYEQIQEYHPDLIPGLINHPGIGFVLVNSAENGTLALGREGIHLLDRGRVEGRDPLAGYGANAARHVHRISAFPDCPDILVNTAYDPLTREISSFEYQVGHHGGLGGSQNHAFILSPVFLPAGETPVVGAVEVNRLLRSWRELVQKMEPVAGRCSGRAH